MKKWCLKELPPATGSAEINTIRKIQSLGFQALVKCNYPGQGLYQLRVSLSDCVSLQVNQRTWIDLRPWERWKIRSERGEEEDEGTGRTAEIKVSETSPCHKSSYKLCPAFSFQQSPFYFKDSNQ